MAKVTDITQNGTTTTMRLRGDRNNPEPVTCVITFPGGSVEVSRTSDGEYWAHIAVDKDQGDYDTPGHVVDSRVDYKYEGYLKHGILNVPDVDQIDHIALRIAKGERS